MMNLPRLLSVGVVASLLAPAVVGQTIGQPVPIAPVQPSPVGQPAPMAPVQPGLDGSFRVPGAAGQPVPIDPLQPRPAGMVTVPGFSPATAPPERFEGWVFRGGWDFYGYSAPDAFGSAYGGFGYVGAPGWTQRGYYGGWGYRAPGFSANFAPYAVPPKPAPPASVAPESTLIINCPADAELRIDDQVMKQTSDTRTFTTRKLTPGKTYQYDLKAEVVRDGQKQILTKRVEVRAGETTRVTLDLPGTALTSR
jgi:uncharacterized protein (TIGR03000 family)